MLRPQIGNGPPPAVLKSPMTDATPGLQRSACSVFRSGITVTSATFPRHSPQSHPNETSPEKSRPNAVSAICAPFVATARNFAGARCLPSSMPSWFVASRRTEEIPFSRNHDSS